MNNHLLLHRLLEDRALVSPANLALIDGNIQLSYSELNQQANILAHRLLSEFPSTELLNDRLIAIYMPHGINMIISVLAVLKSGAAYLPLDFEYPFERIKEIIVFSNPLAIIVEDERDAKFLTKNFDGIRIICLNQAFLGSPQKTYNPNVKVKDNNLAYTIFTSGSTGMPKGVMIEHRTVYNTILDINDRFNINEYDTFIGLSKLSFDLSVYDIFGAFYCGAKLIIIPDQYKKDPQVWLKLINQFQITIWNSVPTLFLMFINYLQYFEPSFYKKAIRSLRLILLSGDWIPLDLPEKSWKLLKKRIDIVSLGGATEASIWSIIFPIKEMNQSWQSIPYGYPLKGQNMYVLDEGFNMLPGNSIGELAIAGKGLARGYLNNKELTNAAFIHLPKTQERIYLTGDIGYLDDQKRIIFLGRKDSQVKLRGHRIEIKEIEKHLNQHPYVKHSVIKYHKELNNKEFLAAYVVLNTSDPELLELYKAQHDEKLSHWQTLYDNVYFDLTETNNQSVNHNSLAAPEAAKDPRLNIIGWNSSYTGQLMPLEEIEDWAEQIKNRVIALKPKKVLEIGCGTGLLLFRLLDFCDEYHGIDFSSNALDYIKKNLSSSKNINNKIYLYNQSANKLDNLPQDYFDLIIISSVTQYFPSQNYLQRVLSSCLDLLNSKGKIFIADVRNFSLLNVLHASIQLSKAQAEDACKYLRKQFLFALLEEHELIIDPRYFIALQSKLPQIKYVQIWPEGSRFNNELTKFRYDVILHKCMPQGLIQAEVHWFDWEENVLTKFNLAELLKSNSDNFIGIKHIPSLYTLREKQFIDWLNTAPDDELYNQFSNRDYYNNERLSPADFLTFVNQFGYGAEFSLAHPTGDGRYDVILYKSKSFDHSDFIFKFLSENIPPIEELTNQPISKHSRRKLTHIIKYYLAKKLPEYMIPEQVVYMPYLPLTDNGKINKRILTPPLQGNIIDENYVPPTTEKEKIVVKVWQEVMQIENIGIHSNFVHLGGDSLLAIQVLGKLHNLGYSITSKQFLSSPTVSGLAKNLKKGCHATKNKNFKDGLMPLTPIQNWFFSFGFKNINHFNQAILLEINEKIDVKILADTIKELIKCHDALRLRFYKVDDYWQQNFLSVDSNTVPLFIEELNFMHSNDVINYIQKKCESYQNKINIVDGPLCALVLFRNSEGLDHLLIIIHHLVVDAVSWRILIQDLTNVYHQIKDQEKIKIAFVQGAYQDWVYSIADYANSEKILNQFPYWSGVLRNSAALPVDYKNAAHPKVLDIDHRSLILDASTTDFLLRDAHKLYATQINDLLLTALLLAFYCWRKQNGLLLDLEGHGRDEQLCGSDISNLLGWFTALFPVYLCLPVRQSEALSREYIAECVLAIKKQMRNIPEKGVGYLPLKYLARGIDCTRLMASPLISFNYLGQLDLIFKNMIGNLSPILDITEYRSIAIGNFIDNSALENPALHIIDINAWVYEGKMSFDLAYSKLHFSEQSIIEFLTVLKDSISLVVDHLKSI